MRIYLAGPITGLTYKGCTNWREWFDQRMPVEVEVLSPMRGKEYLDHIGPIEDVRHLNQTISSDFGIMRRDFFDCHRSDVVVCNLLGAERVSIGTMMECAWCYENHIPLVLIMEDEGNIHEHAMLRACVTYHCTDLEEAVKLTRIALNAI